MRYMISGLVAAVAVMAAAPAMACGYGLCSPCGAAYVSPCAAPVYAAPVVSYSYTNYGGCYGGWAGSPSDCPIRCSSTIMPIRDRPIPVRATGRRPRSTEKAPVTVAPTMVIAVTIAATTCCAVTTDPIAD